MSRPGSTWPPMSSLPMQGGDLVEVDFGLPVGSEPGFRRPAVVVTSDLVLAAGPRTVHVVPVTSNVVRRLRSEVVLAENGLDRPSVAQCHLCTVVSTERIGDQRGTVGAVALAEIRTVIGDLLDVPVS